MADDNIPGNDSNSDPGSDPNVKKIAGQLETVADKIDETPLEDQDAAWRTQINSTLAKISEDLATLKEKPGASPELMALQGQITELLAEVKALKSEPTPQPSSKSGAGDNPGPATPPVTSSAPPVAKRPAKPEKAKRNWL